MNCQNERTYRMAGIAILNNISSGSSPGSSTRSESADDSKFYCIEISSNLSLLFNVIYFDIGPNDLSKKFRRLYRSSISQLFPKKLKASIWTTIEFYLDRLSLISILSGRRRTLHHSLFFLPLGQIESDSFERKNERRRFWTRLLFHRGSVGSRKIVRRQENSPGNQWKIFKMDTKRGRKEGLPSLDEGT